MTQTGGTCEELLEGYVRRYLQQLQAGFRACGAEDKCVTVTPFRRPDGEMVEVELKLLPGGRIRLTDMGDSIGYLHINGLTLTRSVLQDTRKLCRRYGVSLERYELVTEVDTEAGAGERLHALIQSALAVTDLIQKRRPVNRLLFDDVVEVFLVGHRAVYDSNYRVEGEGLPHTVRFRVDSNRNILIQPLSALSETVAFSWAERWAYRFGDIRRRNASWKPYVVLDDRGDRAGVWTPRTLIPLRTDATVVPWRESSVLADALT